MLLFRRPLGTDGTTGKIDPVLARQARDKYFKEFGAEADEMGVGGAGGGEGKK